MIQVRDLRLRPGPIVMTVVLGVLCIAPQPFGRLLIMRVLPMDVLEADPWVSAFAGHLAIWAITLVCIAVMKRFHPGSYGLQRPIGRSLVGTALLWGVFFGLLMLVVDDWQKILHRLPLVEPAELRPTNVAGTLAFQFLFVGIVEETLFRGLLVTYLRHTVSGVVSWGRYQVHVGGVIVALLFALAHVTSFFTRPLPVALGQQLYAVALGVVYAYLYERTGSLVAPIVTHSVSDGVEVALEFVLTALGR
jgi:membrane protease YdiL (CAAX protease family)